jgi:RNA polymerase sigma factor (sigma-70 family)
MPPSDVQIPLSSDPWMERLRSGEPQRGDAIEELRFILHRGLSRSLNMRYGVPFQADDIVQDALLKILDSLDQFEGRSRFITWAMTIATRVGISSLRRQHKREVSLELLDHDDNLKLATSDTGSSEASRKMVQREILQHLNELIETELTARQRLAIRFQLEEVPVDETANRIGSNRNAVYKLVHDARMKLKQGLERRGFTNEHIHSAFAQGT